MDEAEIVKLYKTLATISSLEDEIKNLTLRAPAAIKGWTGWLSHTTNPAYAKSMRDSLKLLTTTLKDSKKTVQDLHKTAEAAQRKNLAKYPTAKAFRDKYLKTSLASANKWGANTQKFMDALAAMTQPLAPFPNPNNHPEKVAWAAMQRYQVHHKELRDGLAKL